MVLVSKFVVQLVEPTIEKVEPELEYGDEDDLESRTAILELLKEAGAE